MVAERTTSRPSPTAPDREPFYASGRAADYDHNRRLNALAQAIAGVAGDEGYLPLSVRYRAAEAAAEVIKAWEKTSA